MEKITKDSIIWDVLQKNPASAAIFMSYGMRCVGCPSARGETVGGAALKHSANLDEMLERLNSLA